MLLAGVVAAADSTSSEATKTTAATTTSDESKSETKTTADATDSSASETTKAKTSESESQSRSESTSASATASATATSSKSGSSKTTASTTSYAAIVITASNTNNGGSQTGSFSGLPTLSSTGVPVPTIVIPTNEYNPFLKQQSVPEGTVFIAVGSILGAIAIAVVAWNIALAIINRRNTRNFTEFGVNPVPLMTEVTDTNNQGNNSGGGSGLESSGVGMFNANNKDSSRSRSMINSGLFFSPTAQVLSSANQQNSSMTNPSLTSSNGSTLGVGVMGAPGTSRASVYVPAGYYDGTNGGAKSVRHMSMYSMSNVSVANTPPPRMPSASGYLMPSAGSSSRLSQNLQDEDFSQPKQTNRAPSAYLDDFLGFDHK